MLQRQQKHGLARVSFLLLFPDPENDASCGALVGMSWPQHTLLGRRGWQCRGLPPPHRNRIWRTCWPLEGGSMLARRGVISKFARYCWSRRIFFFHPKAGSLETPQVGNSAGCRVCAYPLSPLAMPFRVAMRLREGWQERWGVNREPHRSTGRGLGRPVKPKMGFLEKEGFVGANSNGRRGFVTSSSPSLPCSEKGCKACEAQLWEGHPSAGCERIGMKWP